jgi:hypothetical protein
MRHTLPISILLATLPAIAQAQAGETQCTYGDLVRRIVIMTEPGVSVPCEVHYFKDTEAPGEDEVLWRATRQAGYCEEKAAGLVASLEQSGWDCQPTDPGAPARPAEPAEPAAAAEEPADTSVEVAPSAPDDE